MSDECWDIYCQFLWFLFHDGTGEELRAAANVIYRR